MQQAPVAAAWLLPPAVALLQLLGRRTEMQPKARVSSSLCLAVGIFLAPFQLRKHIHNDLQQSCEQCW